MTIITIASTITAFTVIVGFFYKVHLFFRKLEERYENMNDTLKENTMYILKIAMLQEEMPLADRILAGEKYIAMGGNGIIKKKYEVLLKEYEEQIVRD